MVEPFRYRAVLWDFGGVITSSPFEAFNRLEQERGLPRDSIRRINATNPDDNAWARFERAEIDAAAFDTAFAAEARALGWEIDGASVIACLSGDIRPQMVDALDWLKQAGYAIGCITNNVPVGTGAGMARDAAKAAQIAAIMARFDVLLESSKLGIRKPDTRIYQMAADALHVAPAQCIYLDDLGVNCKGATQLGMAAIKVTDGDTAREALWKLLGTRPKG
ncbi:MAG: HAD-IA family hydrolase [Sphingomonadaceae bacterium]|nr:HAD-IA family hydrolase [Sphingomonadaceae bacterium]